MEPPNIRFTTPKDDHGCESCRAFSIKDGGFYCGRFDVYLAAHAICDDYDFAGTPSKPVPTTMTTDGTETLDGRRIFPR